MVHTVRRYFHMAYRVHSDHRDHKAHKAHMVHMDHKGRIVSHTRDIDWLKSRVMGNRRRQGAQGPIGQGGQAALGL